MRAMNWLGNLCFIGMVFFWVCGSSVGGDSESAIQNKPIADFRVDLLERGFDAASAMPLDPHIKDRSRAQEKVLQAALELDQPGLALKYAKGIANWRRGKGLADYAFYSVEHGVTNSIPALLKQAESIAGAAKQEWRQDTVLRRIGQVNTLLLQQKSGQDFTGAADFEDRFAAIDATVLKGGLDDAKGVVNTCLRLYQTYYQNEDYRGRLRNKIEDSWRSMPVFLRLDCLKEMARVALENQDQASVLQIADEAAAMMDGNTWPIEYSIPLVAEFAALRFQAGDSESPRATLENALKTFKERQAEIVDIDRAETLVPIAEAAVVMGDPNTAATVYNDALDVAQINANSRPRAEDLSMICVSMALNGFEPGVALYAKLDRLREALGDPW